jgi:hypothetical protein
MAREIRSQVNPRYRVSLGRCSRKHAKHVLAQLTQHPETPGDLKLKRRWRRG